MPTLIRTNSGIYYAVTASHGRRVWKSLRTRNRNEAYRLFAQNYPADAKPQADDLSRWVEEYLAHVKANHGNKTAEVYDLAFRNFLRRSRCKSVSEVTPLLIDRYKTGRLSEVSPSTVNIELRAFKAFFNCLKRWRVASTNPMDGIRQVRVPQVSPAYLSQEDLVSFLPKISDPWLWRIVTFAAMTGLRLGEVLNLTWERVDLERRLALIESSLSYSVKCGKRRSIPLNSTAIEALLAVPERNGLAFPGKRGGHANSNHVSASFRREVRRAGLDPKLHFHSLRHTFASLLVKKGVSLYQVQQLLGHSSSRITEVYAHLGSSELHGPVQLLEFATVENIDPIRTLPDRAKASSSHQEANTGKLVAFQG